MNYDVQFCIKSHDLHGNGIKCSVQIYNQNDKPTRFDYFIQGLEKHNSTK